MSHCKNGHDLDVVGVTVEINRHGKPYARCRRCKADRAIEERRRDGIGPKVIRPAIERFMAKIEKTDSCWLWKGFVGHENYGRFDRQSAHRFSYQHFVGEIPEGMEIDHKCFVRNCVNPDHLEPVTQAENVRRAVERGSYKNHQFVGAMKRAKTHCPKGHPYSGDNLMIDTHSGGRRCRQCRKEQRNGKAES